MDYRFIRHTTTVLLMITVATILFYHEMEINVPTDIMVETIPRPANVDNLRQKANNANGDDTRISPHSRSVNSKMTFDSFKGNTYSASLLMTPGTVDATRETSPPLPDTSSTTSLEDGQSSTMSVVEEHQGFKGANDNSYFGLDNYGYINRGQLFAERRKMIKENCKKLGRGHQKHTGPLNYLVEKRHSIVYCPIPKVSSTFWKKMLTVTGNRGPKGVSAAALTWGQMKLDHLVKLSEMEQKALLTRGTSLLFIREPYARLFSGYENKIYHSNTMFWKSIGTQIVKTIRNVRDDKHVIYGSDVTFAEFIKYILYLSENGQSINRHFRPMTQVCDPCNHDFDFVGKLETIKDDTEYILEYLTKKYPDINVNMSNLTHDTVAASMKGHVRFLYGIKRVLNGIDASFKNIMLRTWRDFQIRGFVSKSIAFPYENRTDVDQISSDEILAELLKALDQSASIPGVKSQREEALVQAYRTVPLDDMERLQEYLKEDCTLLGYDERPQKLFDRSFPIDTSFDYLAGL